MSWPSHGSRGRHDWWTYLERGYVEPFRDAIREMADVDIPVDDSGRTMLMEVVMYARGEPWLEIANLLIKAGANVNRQTATGDCALHFAPTFGPSCVEIWSTLIKAGANVNLRGVHNRTPLMRVCAGYLDPATNPSNVKSRQAIVLLLLKAGAEVNIVDQYNVSPLQAAAGARNSEVVKILLKAGADPNHLGEGTRSALYEAAIYGYARAVQMLIRAGAYIDAATQGSRSVSYSVLTSGYIIDVEGVTPLIAASEGGHSQVVRLLVDAGADVNHNDSSGFTALMGAARAGQPGMVKFLLDRGANPEATDTFGKNAIAHATEFHNQHKILRTLKLARNKADPS